MDRPVRWIHSTELLAPSAYLSGGELVCTVGTLFTDPDTVRRFVTACQEAGACGICFGVGDVHAEVPTDLVAVCTEVGMPLLQAPMGSPFMAIGEYVAQQRSSAQLAVHDRSEQLITDLLTGVRAQHDAAELLRLVASRLGGSVELHQDARLVARLGIGPGDLTVSCVLDTLKLSWCGAEPAPSPASLETVLRLLDVSLHERDVEEDLRRERTGELVSLVHQRLAAANALKPLVTAAGLGDSYLVFSAWPSGAARVLASALADIPIVLAESPAMTTLITSDDRPVLEAAELLSILCGYSRQGSLAESAGAIAEARAGLNLAQRRGKIVGPEDLTTLEGLLAQQPPGRLTPFAARLIEPLAELDKTRHTTHVETLRAYLTHEASLVETARSEFLHVNTVRHRLARIHQIVGRDPLVMNDRIDLVIGLWAYDNSNQ